MPEAEPKLFEFHAGAARELSIPGGPAGLERCLQFLPDRVYEALRTRGEARFFRLEQHCARAEQGCASAGLPPFDEDAFRQGLHGTTRAVNGRSDRSPRAARAALTRARPRP